MGGGPGSCFARDGRLPAGRGAVAWQQSHASGRRNKGRGAPPIPSPPHLIATRRNKAAAAIRGGESPPIPSRGMPAPRIRVPADSDKHPPPGDTLSLFLSLSHPSPGGLGHVSRQAAPPGEGTPVVAPSPGEGAMTGPRLEGGGGGGGMSISLDVPGGGSHDWPAKRLGSGHPF